MALDFNFMVGGEAGQGVQSVSVALSKAMLRGGLEVFTTQDYESRIRGGHSFARTRVADSEIRALNEKVNILIALNKETVDLHLSEMTGNGESAIIYDREKTKEVAGNSFLIDVPLERTATETTGQKVMSNSVAAGAALGLIEYDFNLLAEVLRQEFIHHGEKIAEDNVKAARAGYDFAREHRLPDFKPRIKPKGEQQKLFISGNEALALAAMAAGCKFVAGYPMTPTTSILEYIAEKGKNFGVKVVQAEDEIAAINMVVGAAYTGVRALTATSGSGFCLMTEGLALAGITETPVVAVLGQRPGPAVGLPTRTEQGELLFALHAGGGEFPRAILAPATVEDTFWLTIKAFNLAEKYQTPVMILTDHYLAESNYTIDRFDFGQIKIDRGQLLGEEELNRLPEYKRHLFTDSGISPRAFPMQGNKVVVTDSDEHNEEGHLIEDAGTRRKMVLKRMKKLEGLRSEISQPRFSEKAGAKLTLVGWGSSYGPLEEAQDLLEKEGTPVNLLHFCEVWPFPADGVASAICRPGNKVVVVENNVTGQFARLLRAETGIKPDSQILKFDGRPFTSRFIIDELKKEALL